MAGQTLLEYQVRLAWAAGARHIVAMVDHIPPALVAALDRLRDEDIAVQIARDAADAADRIHPDERLLVIAAGAFAPGDVIAGFADRQSSALLTFEAGAAPGFERIDSGESWAGFALVRGHDLRTIAPTLGDWDLAATLMRAAVQQGGERLRAGPADGIRHLAAADDAVAATRFLADSAGSEAASPLMRLVSRFAGAPLAAHGMAASLPFELLSVVGPALLAAAALLGGMGWLASGFGALLAALIANDAAARIALGSMRRSGLTDWRHHLEAGTLGFLLLASGMAASRDGLGWGAVVLALWATVRLIEGEAAGRRWTAELALVMLVASVSGAPAIGLGIAIVGQYLVQWWRPTFESSAKPAATQAAGLSVK